MDWLSISLSFVQTIAGTAVGVWAGARITKRYYFRSSEDLEKLVQEMRVYFEKTRAGIRTLARGLEASGQAHVNYDQDGDPTNIEYKATLRAESGPATSNFGVTVTPPAATGELRSQAGPAGSNLGGMAE